jgi:hypothetical protein
MALYNQDFYSDEKKQNDHKYCDFLNSRMQKKSNEEKRTGIFGSTAIKDQIASYSKTIRPDSCTYITNRCLAPKCSENISLPLFIDMETDLSFEDTLDLVRVFHGDIMNMK